jgi:drug/metabolite transporter (DMT)-like permease
MPRGGKTSSSSSKTTSHSSSTSRQAAAATAPPAHHAQNNQVAKPSLGAGIMSGVMTGMAFGAGSEMMRQFFRNTEVGSSIAPFMLPMVMSGLTAWGAHKYLLKPSPYKVLTTAAIFGGTFLVTKNMFSENEQPQH